MSTYEWVQEGDWPNVPDLTRADIGDTGCDASYGGFSCTRRSNHTGRHAAGTGAQIVAVWW